MPLVTPVSSSSSRVDDVFIMRSSGSLDPSRVVGDIPSPAGHLGSERRKEKIIILGPFPPQTMELTSSSASNGSSCTRSLPERQSMFSPIHVPIPAYEDCFQEPFDHALLFDPVVYEAELLEDSMDEVVSDHEMLTPPRTPVSDEESDHRTIVQARLMAVDKLLFDLDCKAKTGTRSSVTLRPVRTPSPRPKVSKKPRLSTIPSSGRPSVAPLDVEADVFYPRHLRLAEPNDSLAYTIPQLRGLTLCEDLPADVPHEQNDTMCHACHDMGSHTLMKRVMPCLVSFSSLDVHIASKHKLIEQDIICRRCFSAALGAVSEGHPLCRCPACLRPMTDFAKMDFRTKQSMAEIVPPLTHIVGNMTESSGPVVMRIDNVAWDLTPAVVEDFLPGGTLANVPVPIHIPLDRYDGRTKDYMYIEVASLEAARKILQSCQNAQMPGGPLTGGRKRAVTISQVHHSELLKELRPHSTSELQSLLALCQASVSEVQPPTNHTSSYVAPNGIAHFVKNRHGPFNALMSILSKVKGKESPSYWDLFHVTAGAIAALGSHISQNADPIIAASSDPDQAVLDKLKGMFKITFGMVSADGRLSPA